MSAAATPAQGSRQVIKVHYIKGQYSSACPFRGDCPLAPGRGLPWVAMERRRQESVETLYVHLHRVHGMPVAEIEALPVQDA